MLHSFVVRRALILLVLSPAAARGQSAQGAAAPAVPQNPPAAQAPAPPAPSFTVNVVETAPLPGLDLPLNKIPAPVQTATAWAMDQSGALDLSAFLNRRFNGVHVNELQGNPYQADVNYRGYTASPLLGTPQGLSVYMDGVRLNQPFGEIVSWDLIPRQSISSMTMMPGSNPLFGLNTLGGALSVQTKDGRSAPGTIVQATFGSDLRRAVEFEHGGRRDSGLNWYVTGNFFAEDGWRDDSPSDVRQLFGKLGWLHASSNLSLTAAYADNALNGNGLQTPTFLDQDYGSVYTKPDETDNQSTFLNLTARHALSAGATASWNLYYRHIGTKTFNGDLNEDSLDQAIYQPSPAEQAALAAAGYSGFPTSGANASNTPFPFWRCLGNVLLNDEPAEKCNGLINRTENTQHNAGLSGQITFRSSPGRRSHQFTVGGAYDRSRVDFAQSTELGYLNPDRSVTGTDAFADGVSGGEVDGEPFDTRVDLDGLIRTWSAYVSDTLSFAGAWHVTLSGRFNHTSIENRDRITPGGAPGSLDGDHAFQRFNPAAGVTYVRSPALNLYAGFSEGSRAPTSIELGCADPDTPCKLPNAMAGDPPLDQVVTRTWEGGARGERRGVTWNAGVFRADNRDDILFVLAEETSFGYFRNFGQTRRQGLELGASGRIGRFTLGTGYTYLVATFESNETVNGESNSTNDAAGSGAPGLEGAIDIVPGHRIPLVPAHLFKAYADIALTPALAVDLDLVVASGSYARGNENNQHEPDGTYYLGPGKTSGYAVVNLGARYAVRPWLQLLAQVNNLFDRRYDTAGQLGADGFTGSGSFIARPFPATNGGFPLRHSTFFAPGAPARFWTGVRLKF